MLWFDSTEKFNSKVKDHYFKRRRGKLSCSSVYQLEIDKSLRCLERVIIFGSLNFSSELTQYVSQVVDEGKVVGADINQ